MAFVVIGSVVTDSVVKGVISTLFGAFVGLIGEDIITGQFKMTMGIDELESGMALVPLLIGVFVISEVIVQAEKAAKIKMHFLYYHTNWQIELFYAPFISTWGINFIKPITKSQTHIRRYGQSGGKGKPFAKK